MVVVLQVDRQEFLQPVRTNKHATAHTSLFVMSYLLRIKVSSRAQ